jgi:hypothetical protein
LLILVLQPLIISWSQTEPWKGLAAGDIGLRQEGKSHSFKKTTQAKDQKFKFVTKAVSMDGVLHEQCKATNYSV